VILRVSRRWTSGENAGACESLLREEVLASIGERQIPGYNGIRLLRREVGWEVEFVTLMEFQNLKAVRSFAGEDYEAAVVPPKARSLLSRFDDRSQH
jgi:hypothetical protein